MYSATAADDAAAEADLARTAPGHCAESRAALQRMGALRALHSSFHGATAVVLHTRPGVLRTVLAQAIKRPTGVRAATGDRKAAALTFVRPDGGRPAKALATAQSRNRPETRFRPALA
jgi:hypothetical protein